MAARRSADLTAQLLAFSRHQVLQPRVVDLNTIVTDTARMLEKLVSENVDVRVVPATEPARVNVDPGQLTQILMNLAVNARDAMPKGGKLTIETAWVDLDEEYASLHADQVDPGPYIRLAVSDTGVGMDAKTRESAFEPFFTTKPTGKGTGLGLSTVHGIVNQSGGHIWVYSELGRGTTFNIYLPRTDATVDPSAATSAGPTAAATAIPQGTRVLVVEDEARLRRMAARALRAAGYQVNDAASTEEALEAMHSDGAYPDLVLTDLVLTGMTGAELAQTLHREAPAVPVLFMSGYTDNAIVHSGVLDPGTPFLAKPFSQPELLRAVAALLASR